MTKTVQHSRGLDLQVIKVLAIVTSIIGIPVGVVLWRIGDYGMFGGWNPQRATSNGLTGMVCIAFPLALWVIYALLIEVRKYTAPKIAMRKK